MADDAGRRDLALTLERTGADLSPVGAALTCCLGIAGERVGRALLERNLAGKLRDPLFAGDIGPLLAPGYGWELEAAVAAVSSHLIILLPGAPCKGEA